MSLFKIGIIGGSVCKTKAIPSTFVSGAAEVLVVVAAGMLTAALAVTIAFDSLSFCADNSADFFADAGILFVLFNVFFLIRIGVPIRIFSSSALSCVSSVSMGLGECDVSVRLFLIRISSQVVGGSNFLSSLFDGFGVPHSLDAA